MPTHHEGLIFSREAEVDLRQSHTELAEGLDSSMPWHRPVSSLIRFRFVTINTNIVAVRSE